MTIGERLTRCRREAGLTLDALAARSGVPKNTINNIISGKTASPKLSTLRPLAQALGRQVEDFYNDVPQFTDRELELLRLFRTLDDHGKNMVELVLRAEYQRMTETVRPAAAPVLTLRRYLTPVSAGTGEVLLDDAHAEDLRCAENAYTKKAHYIVGVKGNSMEPAYSDGDLLLVCREAVGFGQVGIFFMNGMGYLKQRGRDELISLNPDYLPIPMEESVVCQGRVIGVLDPAWVVE